MLMKLSGFAVVNNNIQNNLDWRESIRLIRLRKNINIENLLCIQIVQSSGTNMFNTID